MRQALKRILANGKTLMDDHDEHLRGIADEKLFIQVRRRKDAEEVSRIDRGQQADRSDLRDAREDDQAGLDRVAIASEVMKTATVEGLSPLASEGSLSPIIIGSGENSAYPHVELTDRKVRVGDMVIADIFFRYERLLLGLHSHLRGREGLEGDGARAIKRSWRPSGAGSRW